MGFRTVYGNTKSSNGWPMVDEGSCTWVDIPGCDVTLEIQNGQPLQILRAFAADFNTYVEPLRDADSACWTATNSVDTSNHLSGTAMDLNWNSHPFQVADAGFDAAKRVKVRELLNWYEGMVFWGNDWTDPKDAMHFQLASLANGGNINTYGNPAVDDFIKRKIRPDGFSTRRGAAPPVMTVPLIQRPNGTWGSPSPAWDHLIQRESSGNPTIIQQIIDVNSGGNEAEGLFQITPRTWQAHGGTEFAPSPRLATPQQQAIVAARIFTRNPSGSDWGAGLPGREDASQLASGLVPTSATPTQGDDEMAGWTKESVDRAMLLLENIAGVRRASLSPLRWPGEGDVNTCAGFAWSADANVHVLVVEKLAVTYGDTDAINLLYAVAANTDPTRAADAKLALHILQKVDPVHLAATNAQIQKWLDAEAKAGK